MKSRTRLPFITKSKSKKFGRIVVITGARQTGKTTLVRNLFKDYPYLSIEDPILRNQYSAMTAAQWHELYPKAILDEVQKEPALIESIKSVYDQYQDTHYILLGSSQLLLLQKVKESLAGRCLIEELYPLTLPELLTDGMEDLPTNSLFQRILTDGEIPALFPSFQLLPDFAQKQKAFDYFLKYGGYPALTEKELEHEDRIAWLRNYIKTYLERDVRDLADFKHLEPFVRLKKTSALISGQLVNYSSLAREADITNKTAQQFLHYLELSYQTFMLQPWSKNELKRLSKSPKLHFLDPGILRVIKGNVQGELNGHEFESAIASELYKQAKNIGFAGDYYHLRTFDGREIDFLIETPKGYYAFEIKQSQHISSTDARHLRNLSEMLDKPLLHSFILSNDNKVHKFGEEITAIHAAMFLG